MLGNYFEVQNVLSIFSFKKILQKVKVIVLIYSYHICTDNDWAKNKEIFYPMGKKDLLLTWQCVTCPAFFPQLANILHPFIGVGRKQNGKQGCCTNDSCIPPPAPEQDTRQS